MARVLSDKHRKLSRIHEDMDDSCSHLCANEHSSLQEMTLEKLSPEVLGLILRCLPAKTLLNVSETCRSLHSECIGNGALWKELFKLDFSIVLLVKGPFDSYHDIYRLMYKSQIIFEERNHVTFSGMLPDWMFTWCILNSAPPNLKFGLLPIGKAKRIWGLLDEELPRSEANGSRRSIAWSEGFEAAIAKWGTEASFQEHVLKRLARSQKRVDSLYPEELQARRKRYYKRLRLDEKYAKMNDVLVKNKSAQIHMRYFEPQLIGEHYINGKLHWFGRKQLKEYMKFAIRLYDHAKANLEECRESDLVECVLLTYKDLSSRVQNHFVRWKEFFEYSQNFLERQQKVWRWQIENGIDQCIKYRPPARVQAMAQYREYIHIGDARKFRQLKRYFEGNEKIHRWFEMNNWILQIIAPTLGQILKNADDTDILQPGFTNEATELYRRVKTFLQSGKDKDFRNLLSTVSNNAKSRLKQSVSLIKELDSIIKSEHSDLLVCVETVKRCKIASCPSHCCGCLHLDGKHCHSSARPGINKSKSDLSSTKLCSNKRPLLLDDERPIQKTLNTSRIDASRSMHFLRKRPRASSEESLTEQTAALPSYCVKPGSSC